VHNDKRTHVREGATEPDRNGPAQKNEIIEETLDR
jgi:hypothetical protein